jgi:prephenate dehydrogenase
MRIAIIGLGLIGGSIAMACKKKKVTVMAYDNNISSLEYALKHGYIDEGREKIDASIALADLIVIAVRIENFRQALEQLKPYLNPNQIITDVCSVKAAIIGLAEEVLGDSISQFVPGHPLAGSEKSEIQNSVEDLFANKQIILTPLAATDLPAVNKVTNFWRLLKAEVSLMEAIQHDSILAATSHLPHAISYAFTRMFAAKKAIVKYSAGSYRDMTRVAVSDNKLWANIFIANSSALALEIEQFTKELITIKNALLLGDAEQLINLLKNNEG